MLALATAALAALSPCDTPPGTLAVEVDRRSREVVLRTAPVHLPAATGRGGYDGYHHHGPVSPLTSFAWPVDGWARGFRVQVVDCDGKPTSRDGLHHAVVLHLGRRTLTHPIYERLAAFGQETEDVVLPRTVGIPIARGDSLGLLAAWMPSAAGAQRVALEMRIPYLPDNLSPRPAGVRPLGFDVNYEPGGGASFDLAPGRSVRTRDFEMPLDGRLLLAGGHVHDYATSMRLFDAATGRRVVEIVPRLDASGRLVDIPRHLYGASGRGVKLEAGRRYRLEVTYDNPTGQTLELAGMGILVGLVQPDDPRDWPALDPLAPGFAADVAMLARSGFLQGPTRPAHVHAADPAVR